MVIVYFIIICVFVVVYSFDFFGWIFWFIYFFEVERFRFGYWFVGLRNEVGSGYSFWFWFYILNRFIRIFLDFVKRFIDRFGIFLMLEEEISVFYVNYSVTWG